MTLRRPGRYAALAFAAGMLLTSAVYAWSEVRLRSRASEPARWVPDLRTPDAARGRHLALHVSQCGFCHGADLGGRPIVDDPWIGRLFAPNLTSGRGGIAARYARDDWARAIRAGLAPDGRPLLSMPSQHFAAISDADLGDLIAYLEALAPVDRSGPQPRVGPLTRLVLVSGLAPELIPAEQIDATEPRPSPAAALSSEYGAYLVELGACRVCHHTDLRGGLHPLALPGEPEPPDLSGSGRALAWSQDEFRQTLRSGRTPEGDELDARYMPWPMIGQMTDLELGSIWLYLRSLR